MHLSTLLPLSLSLVSSVLGQAQRSVISINVAQAGAATGAAGVQTSAGAQPTAALAGAQPGPKGSVITIRPQGAAAAATSVPAGQATTGAPGVAGSSPSVAGSAPGTAGQQPQAAAAGSAPVWVVKVGSESNALVFSPNTVTAKPGEFVQFQFYSKNHSVASSAFETPCVPNNAFFSGFMPTEAQGQLTYTIPVRDTNPIWLYCTQAKHCQDGMVGVINPPAGGAQTLQAFQAAAAQAPNNVVPNGGAAVGGTAAGIGASAGTGTGTTPGAPAVAQSTAGAVSIIARRVSWELAGAAMVAWFLL